jgi:hypothetical protein
MAKYPAIAAVGMAVLDQLASARPKPEFANAQFELYQSSNFESPIEEGISLYLYRVTINGALRNPASRIGPTGKRRRPPLPLDLHFMLTAWAKTAAKQQRLLGWAMQQLEDTPILPSGLLNSLGPEPGIFYPDETVEIISDPISIQDMFNIWENLKAKMQISVAYVARMVMIESALEQMESRVVQTRELRVAQETQP